MPVGIIFFSAKRESVRANTAESLVLGDVPDNRGSNGLFVRFNTGRLESFYDLVSV
jgi:hypothetical protein